MRKSSVTLIFLVFSFIQMIQSQSLRQPVAAVYTQLGAYSTKQADVFSIANNQAALATTKNMTAGIYSERRFLLAATSMYHLAMAVPTKTGNFGLNIKYAGFKNFNESQIGLAYARSLGSVVDIGIQFNYYGYRVPGYVNANTVNFEMGALLHLTDQLNAGIHVYNPVGAKFSKTGEKLAAVYNIGLGYDATDNFFVGAEIVKEEFYPVNVRAGLQYQFMKQLFARAGIATATSTTYAGVGVSWSSLRLDISGSYHPQLGLSPGLLLIVNLDKNAIPVQ